MARLRLTPEEEETFVPQLAQIIDYFDQLGSFDASEEEPEEAAGLEVSDQPRESMTRDTFLDNAPQTLDGFVVVPQVKVTGDE